MSSKHLLEFGNKNVKVAQFYHLNNFNVAFQIKYSIFEVPPWNADFTVIQTFKISAKALNQLRSRDLISGEEKVQSRERFLTGHFRTTLHNLCFNLSANFHFTLLLILKIQQYAKKIDNTKKFPKTRNFVWRMKIYLE